jgi:hypothetical protein
MSVVAQSPTTGAFVVGQAGSGTLTVQSGGSLSTVSLTSGAGQASSTRLMGPNASVATSSMTLLANSTFISEITSGIFTPIAVAGDATLGGTYRVEFSGGYMPTVGTSWSIMDAATLNGNFAAIDLSATGSLPAGQQLIVTNVPGGLGRLLQLRVEQVLTLNVDRTTKEVTMTNVVGGQQIAIDGYTVASNAGSLKFANWNSLYDQSVPNWIEANGSDTRLSELMTSGTTTVNGGGLHTIGMVYSPANVPFGTPVEDLTFQYEKSDGSVITAPVKYTGGVKQFNNLVLEIDAAGNGQILNDSPSSVNIEGYTITSSDGSLLFANGQWNSFSDQAAAGGNWLEANPSAGRISEFKSGGASTFNTTNGLSIGHIFNFGGNQSGIGFEFLIAGQSDPFPGAVVFRNFSSITPIGSGGSMPGDFNNDQKVNAADYVLWRKNPGAFGGPEGYTAWRANFGSAPGSGSSLGGVAAVPEPASAWLAIGAVIAIVRSSSRVRRSVR